MAFKVFLRSQENVNYFRRWLLGSLNSGVVDSALICSGFFQERRNYSLSTDIDFTQALVRNRIELTTIGLHSRQWQNEYLVACTNLYNQGVQISGFLARRFHWHAKIFIAYRDQIPAFAIVGSSNMTNPAFGPAAGSRFNHEADVMFWNPRTIPLARAIEKLPTPDGGDKDIFNLHYSAKDNSRQTIQDRLNDLHLQMSSLIEDADRII